MIFQNDENSWFHGYSTFMVDYKRNGFTFPVAVQCRIGSLETDEYILFDTGAAWSVVSREYIEILQNDLDSYGVGITLKTRLGEISGIQHGLKVCLLAEDGEDLEFDCTVLVSKDWLGPFVLGYHGFMENIRFALDPSVALEDSQRFYFGPADVEQYL